MDTVKKPILIKNFLNEEELIYDRHFYDLYIKSSDVSGYISIITN